MTEKPRRRLNRSSKPGGDSVLAQVPAVLPQCWYRVLRERQALGTGYPAGMPSLVDSGSGAVP